jgi:plastocyanin
MTTCAKHPARWMTRRHLLRDAGLTMLSLRVLPLLQACGDGKARVSEDGNRVIEMNDQMLFVPNTLVIRVGQKVTWRNVWSMVHSSTCDPTIAQRPEHAMLPDGAESWDLGLIRKGEFWSQSFDIPGEYTYFCIPHESGGMIGSLSVKE